MKGTSSDTFTKAFNSFAPTVDEEEPRRGGRKRKENQFYQDGVNSNVNGKTMDPI